MLFLPDLVEPPILSATTSPEEDPIRRSLAVFDKAFNLARDCQRERLSFIGLCQAHFTRRLEEIFSFMNESDSIGSTGASKVLHILNPELFPLWDDNIRRDFGLREDAPPISSSWRSSKL
ncbi:hypothetical protein DRO64_09435 [Candidatus Bathyarchaeota archaeon]|nr:MAG: hypothetical protein DRO64_09435 [Candidatus Bathyarchaeota archaeon]